MTDDTLPLHPLLAKAGDGDFLRSVAEAVVQLLMETDVDGLIGAGRHERSGDRTTYRNGYRDRTLDTRLGSLQLRIPKLRQGTYFPPFLEPRKKASEKALISVIQEAWISGVSTQEVDDLVQAMGLSGIGKSTVSKLCKDIDERVGAFLDRPLSGEWPYLWLDATYLKQREGGRIVSVAAIVAVAVNTDGKRGESLDCTLGHRKPRRSGRLSSRACFRRGLSGVKLVISDAHEGLKAAVRRVWAPLGSVAACIGCATHWPTFRKVEQSMAAAALRQTFIQPDRASASQTLRHVADQLRAKWPKLAAFIDESETDVLAHMDFPAQHRRQKTASTNGLEQLQQRSKETRRCRWHLGQRGIDRSPDWRSATRAPTTSGRSQNRYMQTEVMSELAPA